MNDGTDALCHELYKRRALPKDYLGGSESAMLHAAATALREQAEWIAELEAENERLKKQDVDAHATISRAAETLRAANDDRAALQAQLATARAELVQDRQNFLAHWVSLNTIIRHGAEPKELLPYFDDCEEATLEAEQRVLREFAEWCEARGQDARIAGNGDRGAMEMYQFASGIASGFARHRAQAKQGETS